MTPPDEVILVGAVMRTLTTGLLLGLFALNPACNRAPDEPRAAPSPGPLPAPPAPPGATASRPERVGARHVLIAWRGSERAAPTITRTKEEAKVRAEEALKKAKDCAKFEDLVKDYSDEPGAAQRGGDLGQFPKGRMVPQFQEGLEKTKVGGVSDIVETPFGYHVILRTK